ncbi:MAG: hypothetical protein MJZ20_03010 [Bacteroidaceae bacterium]|nr:hypothetical protein [Bacteroidaceae bacterium]
MEINKNFVEELAKKTGPQLNAALEINYYLPFMGKKALVERVINASIEIESGYVVIDEITKYITFTMEILKAYTNLEFSVDMETAILEFDMLCASGVLSKTITLIEGEYKALIELLNMQADYVRRANSVDAQMARLIDKINNKLDNASEFLKSQIDKVDFDDMGISKDDIAKLKAFLNK